jgi:hypothetical protein
LGFHLCWMPHIHVSYTLTFGNLLCAERVPLPDITSFLRQRVSRWSKSTSCTASPQVSTAACCILKFANGFIPQL